MLVSSPLAVEDNRTAVGVAPVRGLTSIIPYWFLSVKLVGTFVIHTGVGSANPRPWFLCFMPLHHTVQGHFSWQGMNRNQRVITQRIIHLTQECHLPLIQ